MLPVYYDLHIHSALSPCAGDDMTPNDIVGMALLNGLELIAVTDHNSLSNVAAAVKAAHGHNLIVLPGAEITTVEEVHVLCLFSDIESASHFEDEMVPYYSTLSNRIDIFGNQTLFDENDRVIGEIERMLIAPTSISFDALYHLVHKCNGAFIPAHIDREAFSVISNLGFLPPHLKISTVEISLMGAENDFDKKNADLIAGNRVIISSDAHQLWSINEKENFIMLPERTAEAAIDFLR